MFGEIGASDLVAGDVILYKGTSLISRLIQFFDGTDFSHASLYLGDGMVGEAIITGLERQTLQQSAPKDWIQAHRLKEPVMTMDPVLAVGNAYLDEGERYAFEQLLMCAFLCLTRKLKLTPSLRILVRNILDAAALTLTQLISGKKELMICSEFVYRAYDQALPAPVDVYSLEINRPASPSVAFAISAAAPTPVKGQGVHPQSLLAMHNASVASSWLGAAPTSFATMSAESQVAPVEEIESLAETYLAEVQAAPQAMLAFSQSAESDFVQLSSSINSFAMSLYGAAHPERDQEVLADVPSEWTANAYLMQTAADFVTPGDLYKTPSLYEVGRIIL